MNFRFPALFLAALAAFAAVSCSGSSSKKAVFPAVISISPASGSTNVLRNAPVIITFSAPLDSSVKGGVSFTAPTASFPAGEIAVSGSTVTIAHSAFFAASTSYSGIAVNGFKSADGKVMADYADASYHFTTGADADTTAPTILSVAPAPGSTDVARDSNIVITFSEPLGQTIGAVSISTPSLTFSPSELSVSGSTVTVNPTADFTA